MHCVYDLNKLIKDLKNNIFPACHRRGTKKNMISREESNLRFSDFALAPNFYRFLFSLSYAHSYEKKLESLFCSINSSKFPFFSILFTQRWLEK